MNTPSNTRLTGALKRESVKKNVAAIHVSGKLSLLQRKLSNVLLLNAYDTLTSQSSHRIDAQALCLMIGYNSNDVETLKTALRGLAETVAEWDMLDEAGRQEWGVSALLSYAKLKGGVCEYAYSPALAEKLHDPKVFALINLNIQRQFTGGHALALYENCFRFVKTGSTGWWDLDIFRRLMGVDGSDYYQSYKHLNAKVIKPAVAEINKVSDIIVEPETRKMGRAVSHIRFLIRRNPQLAILNIDDGEGVRASQTYARLMGLGVSDRLARQWIAEHGEDYVTEKIDYVAGQAQVRSPAKYLSRAINEDFVATEAPQTGGASTPEIKQRSAKLRRVQELVQSRSPTQRDADKRLFMSQLTEDAARLDFENHGWMSALNAEAIFAFWDELVPEDSTG
ncbi:Initiator Replication protein [Aliiroseovarius halocynthiae]|uniref:Replication initiation protein n=1 Tax=Aliiroseovarius halocynthiae TaxID=985055 RepID=A0A545SL98_9RHOB|nr:replication initiation protein [Aliiroseovarius halocynthiae]TQV65606.1 replication initiation protein [Aliiroseovarius halocynthiae]SMR84089.1 Initiator Replication protein [Aliiroseovarius halocynthiae]